MYQNSLKLIQSILFILLLIMSVPILFLLAVISHLVEKPINERSTSEDEEQ